MTRVTSAVCDEISLIELASSCSAPATSLILPVVESRSATTAVIWSRVRVALLLTVEVELALFNFLLSYERVADELRDPEGDRERLLESLRARVLATPRSPVSVDVLAAERGMSRSHFTHFFRARTGLTPARFMTEARVHEAARQLLTSRAPLKEIAIEWGFANVNHFGKVFRRFHHTSPAAYRNSFGS